MKVANKPFIIDTLLPENKYCIVSFKGELYRINRKLFTTPFMIHCQKYRHGLRRQVINPKGKIIYVGS